MEEQHKALWINYDEEWLYAWMSQTNVRMCELLEIEKANIYIYHKNHIEKVMAIAFTAYAFDSNVENGGDKVKIGLFCIQGAQG